MTERPHEAAPSPMAREERAVQPTSGDHDQTVAARHLYRAASSSPTSGTDDLTVPVAGSFGEVEARRMATPQPAVDEDRTHLMAPGGQPVPAPAPAPRAGREQGPPPPGPPGPIPSGPPPYPGVGPAGRPPLSGPPPGWRPPAPPQPTFGTAAPPPQFGVAGPPPGMPAPPRDYRADMRAAIDKGNSFLGRLLRRGVNGELLSVPAFQSYRAHQPDPLTVVAFIAGVVLVAVFAMMPGVIGLVLMEVMWAATAFVLIAIGTKRAFQFIVYGVGVVGALGYVGAAYYAISAFTLLANLPYGGSTSVGLLIVTVVAILLAILHVYIAVQVHREIRKIAAGQ